MTKKYCISGYYGFDNFGDETILKILVENLKKFDSDITVFSSNPIKTSEKLNVSSVKSFDLKGVVNAIKNSDCLISGGGSLLQDVTSKKSLIYYLGVIFLAQFFRKKTIIFAQGIGPINDKFLQKVTKFLLKKCSYISVRDEKSLALLKDWNINAELCSDPVWNIDLNKIEKTEKVGVQLRRFASLTDEFLYDLAVGINKNYSDKEVLVLSLQNKLDMEVCTKFNDILKEINPNINSKVVENTSNDEVINTIASINTLIAMRYHACLIAIKSQVKLLPINYDIKVENLANMFELNSLSLNDFEKNNKTFEEFYSTELVYDEEKIKAQNLNFEKIII